MDGVDRRGRQAERPVVGDVPPGRERRAPVELGGVQEHAGRAVGEAGKVSELPVVVQRRPAVAVGADECGERRDRDRRCAGAGQRLSDSDGGEQFAPVAEVDAGNVRRADCVRAGVALERNDAGLVDQRRRHLDRDERARPVRGAVALACDLQEVDAVGAINAAVGVRAAGLARQGGGERDVPPVAQRRVAERGERPVGAEGGRRGVGDQGHRGERRARRVRTEDAGADREQVVDAGVERDLPQVVGAGGEVVADEPAEGAADRRRDAAGDDADVVAVDGVGRAVAGPEGRLAEVVDRRFASQTLKRSPRRGPPG